MAAASIDSFREAGLSRVQERADELRHRGKRCTARLDKRVVPALGDPSRLDASGQACAQCFELSLGEELVVFPLDGQHRTANAGDVWLQAPAGCGIVRGPDLDQALEQYFRLPAVMPLKARLEVALPEIRNLGPDGVERSRLPEEVRRYRNDSAHELRVRAGERERDRGAIGLADKNHIFQLGLSEHFRQDAKRLPEKVVTMMGRSERLRIAGAPAVEDQGTAACCPNDLIRYVAPHPSASQRIVKKYE